jgi:hypothetical protein
MFGFRRKSIQEQRTEAIAQMKKDSQDLFALKDIRRAAETKDRVRIEKKRINELKTKRARELLSKLSKNMKKATKKSNSNKAGSVFDSNRKRVF